MTLITQAQYRLDLSQIEVARYFDWYSVPTRRSADPNISHLMRYLIKCSLVYGQPIPEYAWHLASLSSV